MDAYEARNAHQDSLPDGCDPFADPYNDKALKLYFAYLEELFPGKGRTLAGLLGALPETAMPVSVVSQEPDMLPDTRHSGRVGRLFSDAGYVIADAGFEDDLRFSLRNRSLRTGSRVTFKVNYHTMTAYDVRFEGEVVIRAPKPVPPRRPRNLAEAREQAEQRKREAQQRADARKNAHQVQATSDYMDVFYGEEGVDSKYQQDMDVRADLQ